MTEEVVHVHAAVVVASNRAAAGVYDDLTGALAELNSATA